MDSVSDRTSLQSVARLFSRCFRPNNAGPKNRKRLAGRVSMSGPCALPPLTSSAKSVVRLLPKAVVTLVEAANHVLARVLLFLLVLLPEVRRGIWRHFLLSEVLTSWRLRLSRSRRYTSAGVRVLPGKVDGDADGSFFLLSQNERQLLPLHCGVHHR